MGHLLASRPNKVLAIDFFGFLKNVHDGTKQVLVIIGVFSKFTQVIPPHDQKAPTVAYTLIKHWFYQYGVQACFHSDHDHSFKNVLVHQLCDLTGIQKTHTTPYHPQGNGQSERFNRTMCDLLWTLSHTQKCRWPEYLPQLVFNSNSTIHQSTMEPPYFLIFGQEPQLSVDFLLDRVRESEAGLVCVWEHQGRLQVVF